MENRLNDELGNYEMVTLNLIEALEEGNYDLLDDLLEEREMIINNINDISYTKDEFVSLCTKFKMVLLQEKLTTLINEKRKEIKRAIDKLNEHKSANRSYNNKLSVDSLYINKKL